MRYIVVLAAALLVACSTKPSPFAYVPAAPPPAGPPGTVSDVTVTDHRDEKPNRLATVRGSFGNQAGVLNVPQSVAALVRTVFTDALRRRRMLAPTGPVRLEVTLDTFYGTEYFVGKAELKMRLVAYDRANQVIYRDTVSDRNDAKFKLSLDSTSARVEKLRGSLEELLTRNVDRMLDKPELTQLLAAPNAVAKPTSNPQ